MNSSSMVNSEMQPEDHFDESSTEEIGTDHDESDEDPTFDIHEETCRSLSQLSLKKSKSRIPKAIVVDSSNLGEVDDVETITVPMELYESDLKGFEKVEKLIQAAQLEKLKVEECKLYLRKHGLRLTGKKDVLIHRITEHLEIINGGGENKYPVSSFVLNCKGDACTGDIVMFEQNVYEMFSIASRSATGPPCGTRVVAGRIVKESYGAAKQQHTFTIEVLWSKGVKPFPPLHPLLIKGRNLYRLQTMRQRWDDEEKRRQVLLEKHSRGACARSNRETRIQVKEMRKTIRGQRVPAMTQEQRRQPEADTKRTNIYQPPGVQSQTQQPVGCPVILSQWSTQVTQQKPAATPNTIPVFTAICQQNVSRLQPNLTKPQNCNVIEQKTWGSETSNGAEHRNNGFTAVENHRSYGFHPVAKIQQYFPPKSHDGLHGGNHGSSNESLHKQPSILCSSPRPPMHHSSRNDHGFNVRKYSNENGKFPQRQPLTTLNSPPKIPPLHRCGRPMERQVCRYYSLGRCHYGDNCRYAHENGDRRVERFPNNQRYYGHHNR